jgi:hypothetical protein
MDPELFFTTNNMPHKLEQLLEKTCLRCPIFDNCLDYALNVKVDGYWAGTTDKTRIELRRFFGITPVRIDEVYKDSFESQTKDAKHKRAHRQRMREAG